MKGFLSFLVRIGEWAVILLIITVIIWCLKHIL